MSKNDITGDEIKSKPSNDLYSQGWERIFGKKRKKTQHMNGSAVDANKVEAIMDSIFGDNNATSSKKNGS